MIFRNRLLPEGPLYFRFLLWYAGPLREPVFVYEIFFLFLTTLPID
jgi:hypothetical protein